MKGAVLLDRFERPDTASGLGYAETGQLWSLSDSNGSGGTNWHVSGGSAVNTAGGSENYVLIDSGVSDFVLNAVLTGVPSSGDGGIWFRGSGAAADGWLLNVEVGASRYALYSRGAYNYSSAFATLAVAPTIGDVITISAIGNTIDVQVNNTTAQYGSAFASTQTQMGFRCSGGGGANHLKFGNLSVIAEGYRYGVIPGGGYG